MKTTIAILSFGLLIVGCKDKTVKEDLGTGFEISGDRETGIFKIKQNGVEVARLDLTEESLDYSAHSKNSVHAGHLSIPIDSRSGRGCAATLTIPNGDGLPEGHQVLERRVLGGYPDPDDISTGAAVYHYAPYEKKIEQGGTGQPATRSQSMSEGSDKPQPDAEGHSR